MRVGQVDRKTVPAGLSKLKAKYSVPFRHLAGGLCALFFLTTAAPLAAHPYGPRYYSLRTEVRMGADGLQTTIVLEIPTLKVLREFARMYGDLDEIGSEQDEAYRALQFDRLKEGLQVRLNGQALPGEWRPADVPINGKGGENFFLYILTFAPTTIDLGNASFELVIDNQSFPNAPMYYSAFAAAEDGWRVAENSVEPLLGEASAIADVSENPAGWTRNASARELRVRFERDPTP